MTNNICICDNHLDTFSIIGEGERKFSYKFHKGSYAINILPIKIIRLMLETAVFLALITKYISTSMSTVTISGFSSGMLISICMFGNDNRGQHFPVDS